MNLACLKKSESSLSTITKAKSISSDLTCKVCSNFFTDPRLLPCLHSFCFECLTSETRSCPICKKSFEVPNGGLSTIPKDLRKQYEVEVAEYGLKIESSSDISCDRCLNPSERTVTTFCCDCRSFLCKRCAQDHTFHKEMHKHKLIVLGKEEFDTNCLLDSIPHKTTSCQVHSDEVLKFYCETCQQLVCRDCIILKHNNHKYDRVEQVAEKGKKELKSLLSEATSAADQLQVSASKAGKMIIRVQEKKKFIDEFIKSEIGKLRETIDSREKYLLLRNREINFEKETALKIQQESMTSLKVKMQQIVSQISEALLVYNPTELLSAYATMATGLIDIKTQFSSLQLELCKTDNTSTSFLTSSFVKDIEKFGEITGGCFARNSTASLYPSVLIQGEHKSLNITARDADGKPYKHGGENVVAYLSPLDSEKTSTFTAEDNNDGTYSVTIIPQSIGEHSLDIKIGNESIQSSPFIVYVRSKRNYNNLRPVLNISTSYSPYDVTVSENKLFIVCNGPNIIVADKDSGALLAPITCPSEVGSIKNQLYGIAAQDNFLYISHQKSSCIYKLTTAGKYVATIGSKGSGNGQLQTPRGLCTSTDGELFVAENSGNRVSVFKTDGTFVRHIQEKINSPCGVAIDPTGNIHVSNHSAHTITVYTHDGKFVREYGNGQLTYPIGVVITADGFSVVAEYQQYSRILIFNTANFSLVSSVQDISYGYGMACDRDGSIYVCAYQNRRIVKY